MYVAGISSSSVFNKTDKSKPLGAAVSALNVFAGQPVERGASPLLYAAASPDLDGKPSCRTLHQMCQAWQSKHPPAPAP